MSDNFSFINLSHLLFSFFYLIEKYVVKFVAIQIKYLKDSLKSYNLYRLIWNLLISKT